MPNGTTVRTCAQCNTEIPTHKYRFCSPACRLTHAAARRKIHREPRTRYTNTCAGCEQTYVTTNRHSQVCSLDCRWWINPQVKRVTDIPITHPAHPHYEPPRQRVSLRHSERGHWTPVIYEPCSWCGVSVIVTPYTAHWSGHLHCSKRCVRARAKRTRRAREHGASGSFTWSEFMRVFIAGGHRCAYCDLVIDGQPDPDHVIPLSRGGSNSITNIVPSCRICNCSKSDLTLTDWADRRHRLGLSPRRVVLEGSRFRHLALASAQTCRSEPLPLSERPGGGS